MKIILYVFVCCLSLGCTAQNECEKSNNAQTTNKTLTYLALGDSYTIGESVTEKERYPNQLVEMLKVEGLIFSQPKIIAQTGWTTKDLMNGIAAAEIEGQKYDLVSLLIGVNNQYQGRSIEEYKKEFKILLNQAIAFADGDKTKVFVLSIPDYGYTPFGARKQEKISKEIDAFNLACKNITEENGLVFYDITSISRNALKDPQLVAEDQLHPSGKMYKQWMELILDKVVSQLKE